MSRIVITGAGGFIGSRLARYICMQGGNNELMLVDNFSKSFKASGKALNEQKIICGIPIQIVDCNSVSFQTALLKFNPDAIFHLAGQSSGERSIEDMDLDIRDNVCSLTSCLKALGDSYGKVFIGLASSMSVYGDQLDATEASVTKPISPYGYSKLHAEQVLSFYSAVNREATCISYRLFNVYGPGQDLRDLKQGMVSIFLSMAIKSGHITVRGSLGRIRDFIYIDDVVESILRCQEASNEPGYSVINISTGIKTSVGDLLDLISGLHPCSYEVLELGTPYDQFAVSGNCDKLAQLIEGFTPRDLASGLEEMYNNSIRNCDLLPDG